MAMTPAVAGFMSALRQRKVIDDCIAVDIMRDGIMVEAPPQLSEIKKFGCLGPDG